MIWKTAQRSFDLTRRGLIMGILNVTPDSFSDGGKYQDAEQAVDQGLRMEEEGADLLDIGGESTRPGASPVDAKEELRRILPVIHGLRRQSGISISVDTMKAEVAAAALQAGADVINDISGLRNDPHMARIAGQSRAGLVLMHMQGTPQTMQRSPIYGNVVEEVKEVLQSSADCAINAGVCSEALVFDPGIGFGKTLQHNLTLLRHLPRFQLEGRPVLLGVSRKSFLSQFTGSKEYSSREAPTTAITAWARAEGARIFRVHAVRENVHALRMMEAILQGPPDGSGLE